MQTEDSPRQDRHVWIMDTTEGYVRQGTIICHTTPQFIAISSEHLGLYVDKLRHQHHLQIVSFFRHQQALDSSEPFRYFISKQYDVSFADRTCDLINHSTEGCILP